MKTRNALLHIVVAITVLGFVNSSYAAVVYDNGSHISNGIGASGSNFTADNFALSSNTVIAGIQWKGLYFNSAWAAVPDNFEIRIYNDDGTGSKPTPLGTAAYDVLVGLVGRFATGERAFGLPVYQYSATVPAFNAVAGSTYWLEVHNNFSDSVEWYWSIDLGTGSDAESPEGGPWFHNHNETTFKLFNTPVPEPSTFALAALGAATLYLARRAQAQQKAPH